MTSDTAGVLDEAYQRLHQTGPEFDGWLSNHGPMATEAMVRHGHAENVGPWLDSYVRRLEDFPRGTAVSAASGVRSATRCVVRPTAGAGSVPVRLPGMGCQRAAQ